MNCRYRGFVRKWKRLGDETERERVRERERDREREIGNTNLSYLIFRC